VKNIILALVMIFIFSGCKVVEMEAKKYAKQTNVDPYVTYLCLSYPFQTTGECKGLMEAKVLCGSTKVCFGFSELMKSPDGMSCYYHDFIKDD